MAWKILWQEPNRERPPELRYLSLSWLCMDLALSLPSKGAKVGPPFRPIKEYQGLLGLARLY